MSEKKELKEKDIKNVSGGWMEETDDYPEDDLPIIKGPASDDNPEDNIKGSNARPNR